MTKIKKRCFPRGWRYKDISFSRFFFLKSRLSQNATFQIQRLKYNVTCFPRIIFPYFFKPQRLKYNVWNATLLVFRVSFSRTFSKISLFHKEKNRNAWKYKLLLISLKCLHYRYKTIKIHRQCSLQISLYMQQWKFLYHFIDLTLRLFSRNTTVRMRTW
jgi:hypothetical protein